MADKAEKAKLRVKAEKEELKKKIATSKAAIERAEKAEAEAQSRIKAAEQRMERLAQQ